MHILVQGQDQGYLLSLATLRAVFKRISYDHKSWRILETILDDLSPRVRVEQRDDENIRRLNELIYSIPIEVPSGKLGTDDDILVSLHVYTLDAEKPGRHLTRRGIREDCMSDFAAFWYPLAALLDIYAKDFLRGLV